MYPCIEANELIELRKQIEKAIKRVSAYFEYLKKTLPELEPPAFELVGNIQIQDYNNLGNEKVFQKVHSKKGAEYDYHLAITLVHDMDQKKFDKIKRFFFELGILHKATKIENLRNTEDLRGLRRIVESVIMQSLYAFALYFYSLDKIPYDFIIGIDVTKDKDKSGRYYGISGAAVVQTGDGQILKVIPRALPQSSAEAVDMSYIFEIIDREVGEVIRTKGEAKILLLRDGRMPWAELAQLKKLSAEHNYDITVIEIIKRQKLRFFYQNYVDGIIKSPGQNYYFKIGETYYLIPHYLKTFIKVPIKLERKYHVTHGKVFQEKISEDDVLVLTKLTKLNYSQPRNPDKMKLPTPVHLSHRLINYERRRLRFNRPEFLNEGALYFL